ncbi:hypothetical protein [Heyndrickxia acidiproducens]|uniref:hypothetical protein n=1 Tax=Heyndrickxia acidiproducens TaxID=1121084 RepID=UPI00036CA6F6|nr:hypothetical protein [Heyndrickxia acidiproducens]
MFVKMKKKLTALLDTVSEMLGMLIQLKDPRAGLYDCIAAIQAISTQLEKEEILPVQSLKLLRGIQSNFQFFLNDINQLDTTIIEQTSIKINSIKAVLRDEVKAKLNIVFFPYKVSMWDSLASVYEAAAKDEDCEVKVVPIPYYQLSRDQAIYTYEGDRFPSNIPITYYSQYKVEEQQPDIIFVHNIYDNFNTLTQIHEKYFTTNLKKYTDMLVYVPYYTASFIPYEKGNGFYPYNMPSIKNIDKFIMVNETEKEIAIREGIPENKILVSGSPKLDSMVKTLQEGVSYPPNWLEKISGKTVYLINTGCLYFANNPFLALEKLIDFFNIPRFVENSIVIWRPHPLTKTSILKNTPFFLAYFLDLIEKISASENTLYKGIMIDESDNYFPALMAADVLITADSSILRSYLLTEKRVLFLSEKMPESSLLPSNVFYYAFDQTEPWYELVKKFANGYDPLATNRKGVAQKIYTNSDGTSGEKIYYKIKLDVLQMENA